MKLEWKKSSSDPLFTWVQDDSTVMTLMWERRSRPFMLEWVGPDKVSVTAVGENYYERSIAVVLGPPGRPGTPGIKGDSGIQGIQGIPGSAIVPDVLDGGNF